MKNTEILRVKQRAIRSVLVERIVSIEVPAGLRETSRIISLIARGDLDYGPFPFEPVEGSEYLETADICFLGKNTGPADIPMRKAVQM